MNLRPSGYEPDELPGCSTPRYCCFGPRLEFPAGVSGWSLLPDWSGAREGVGGFGRPGGDLLFRALRRSTIGAEGFHGRVRDGIGCYAPRYGHQAVQSRARPGDPDLGPGSRWSSAAPDLIRGPAQPVWSAGSELCGCLLRERGLPPRCWAPGRARGTRAAGGVAAIGASIDAPSRGGTLCHPTQRRALRCLPLGVGVGSRSSD